MFAFLTNSDLHYWLLCNHHWLPYNSVTNEATIRHKQKWRQSH